MPLIDIANPSKYFEEHLLIENNFRIIFSGKFGIGKTFFLSNYFDDRSNIYNKFLISPVNYVVSSNEDIFELIKADIIKDLFITRKIDLEKLPDDNTLQKISTFVNDKKAVIGKFLLNVVGKLSSTSPVPEETVNAIGKIYKDYKSNINRKKEDEVTRSEYLAEHLYQTTEKIGSIYEHNYITKVINTFLDELKENGKKKNVLIIDDLDRVDPEHIFRILNVLSAHNDHFDAHNKFAFDHIIVVCDIENIRRIFFHKYGHEVDFEGYIDKFYSTSIFEYSNKDALSSYIKTVLNLPGKSSQTNFMVFVLSSLVENNHVTIRQLLKHRYDVSIKPITLYEQRGIQEDTFYLQQSVEFLGNRRLFFIQTTDFEILNFLKLLSNIFGSLNNFFKLIEHLKLITAKYDYSDVKEIVDFLALQMHISKEQGDDLFFSKSHDKNGSGYLMAVGFPTISFLAKEYRLMLQWSQQNPYNSEVSYFDKCLIKERNPSETSNGKSGVLINSKDIFDALEKIIVGANRKGYLSKIGVSFHL